MACSHRMDPSSIASVIAAGSVATTTVDPLGVKAVTFASATPGITSTVPADTDARPGVPASSVKVAPSALTDSRPRATSALFSTTVPGLYVTR